MRPDQSQESSQARSVMITELSERSRQIFRQIVDAYVETGEPIGSRTLSRLPGQHLSPATIRSVMADLEDEGLLYAPHTSAGRVPTEVGPRAFVGRALVVVVADNGMLENRVIEVPVGIGASSMIEAGNYLTARLTGRSFAEARAIIEREMAAQRGELDSLTQKVVQAGLATWGTDQGDDDGVLIVRGHAHLLADVTNVADLERIRTLFEVLETKKTLIRLLELVQAAQGVQIFIGSENALFGLSGCSMVVAPYVRGQEGSPARGRVVGALGVIGPTRMNYARIIPMVDYTARVVSRLLGN